MNIAITFRQMEATDAVKAYTTDKVGKLQKFLRSPMKTQITLSCTQHRLHSAEVDLHSGSEHFHAHETSEDMYATIDKVMDKLERQIRGHKEERNRKGGERASQRLVGDVGEE
jgi:putative sigma-54 modulation protein